MNLRTRYIISTVGYGVCAVLGFIVGMYFLFQRQWIIAFLAVLFVYVSVDNFFCGDRCRVAGFSTKGHYTVPPFLKGEKR